MDKKFISQIGTKCAILDEKLYFQRFTLVKMNSWSISISIYIYSVNTSDDEDMMGLYDMCMKQWKSFTDFLCVWLKDKFLPNRNFYAQMKLKQQGRVGKSSDYMTCSYAQLDDSFVCKNNKTIRQWNSLNGEY